MLLAHVLMRACALEVSMPSVVALQYPTELRCLPVLILYLPEQ